MSDFGAELGRLMRARGVGVRELHRRSGYSAGYITQLRQGLRNPSANAARDLDDALGAGGALATIEARPARGRAGRPAVQRTALPGLAGAPVFGTVTAGGPSDGIGQLAALLTDLDAPPGQQDPQDDPGELAARVDEARGHYQACRYVRLAATLPGLIRRLNAACAVLDGDARDRAHALAADAHHVTAGLLLKHGDQGLAALAADRSMRAALASGDPVTIASSARIITHSLMSGGHLTAAVATASRYATRLGPDLPERSPDSLSVYGALLLRGAVAAAQDDNRRTAHELLGEADDTARRLGWDANCRWTAFGPVNVTLHRISIAVTLGDAGTAIDLARAIDPAAITVTERKATLLIDTARAFLQRDRHENAYLALRAAHEAAPEEVTGRAAVRNLVRDLAISAPAGIRRDTAQFATSIGVNR